MSRRFLITVIVIGVPLGTSTTAYGVDSTKIVKLEYDALVGSLAIDTGGELASTIHITSEAEFFTGPEPPEVGPPFDRFSPGKLFLLDLSGMGPRLEFPSGSVEAGLTSDALRFGMDVDVTYVTGGTLQMWCLNDACSYRPNAGDFNGNNVLDPFDIDGLTDAIVNYSGELSDDERKWDLNVDGSLTLSDREAWVRAVRKTYFGDADLNGEFSSSDLVSVFTSGEFEDGIVGNSGWSEGDWDGDRDFSSSDLVLAFQDGGYGQGARIGTPSVPEPSNGLMAGLAALLCFSRRYRKTSPSPDSGPIPD